MIQAKDREMTPGVRCGGPTTTTRGVLQLKRKITQLMGDQVTLETLVSFCTYSSPHAMHIKEPVSCFCITFFFDRLSHNITQDVHVTAGPGTLMVREPRKKSLK